jgi:hypothetical protein
MPILGVIASSRPTALGAYESIASSRLTSSSQSVVFSSIPSTYKHLQIRWAGAANDNYLYFTTNLGTSGKQARMTWYGGQFYNGFNGGGDPTYGTELHFGGIGGGNSAAGIIDILDYSSTTKKKTGYSRLVRPFAPDSQYSVNNMMWFACGDSTSAISSVTLQGTPTYPLETGTTVSLYGIKG